MKLKDLNEARERYSQIKEAWGLLKETVGGADPGPGFFATQVKEMAVHLLHDLGTEEQGCRLRAWCYTVMYESMGMGSPPRPRFQGSQPFRATTS